MNSELGSSLAFLYVYESIQLENVEKDNDVQFLKNNSDSCRYYLYHNTGVHSVYLPWLESAKKAFQKLGNNSFISFRLKKNFSS